MSGQACTSATSSRYRRSLGPSPQEARHSTMGTAVSETTWSMAGRHDPHRFPAWHASATSSTDPAPARTAARTVRSLTTLQWQMIMRRPTWSRTERPVNDDLAVLGLFVKYALRLLRWQPFFFWKGEPARVGRSDSPVQVATAGEVRHARCHHHRGRVRQNAPPMVLGAADRRPSQRVTENRGLRRCHTSRSGPLAIATAATFDGKVWRWGRSRSS